jgi:hypothetical protein
MRRLTTLARPAIITRRGLITGTAALAAMAALPSPARAAVAFGSAAGFTHTGGTTATFTLSASPGDLIIAPIATGTTGAASTTTIAGGALTWQKRGTTAVNTNLGWNGLDIYYAISSSTVTSQTITVTTSVTMDDMAYGYAIFTGVIATVWDTSGTLPVKQIVGASSTTPTATVSTLAAHTAVIALTTKNNSPPAWGTMSPGTFNLTALAVATSGGTNFNNLTLWYGLYSTAQTGLVVSNPTSAAGFIFYVDALAGDILATGRSRLIQ